MSNTLATQSQKLGPHLVAAAALLMLLTLFLPVANLSIEANGVSTGASPVSGAAASGVIGWLAFLAVAAAAASRYLPAIAQYRKWLDIAALVLMALATLYGLLSIMNAASQLQAAMPLGSVSATPWIGLLTLVLAAAAMVLARRGNH